MIEVCHNLPPFPQPSPNRNPGGDCFACAMTAALRWLYPEDPVSFDAAWGYFMAETVGGGRTLSNSWPGLRSALYAASHDDRPLEVACDLVMPEFNREWYSYPWWRAHPPTEDYARRLEGWLRGGWVAFTEIAYGGGGPRRDGRDNHNDHIVLIDGVRSGWAPWNNGARRMGHAVHVVCSTGRGAYWIDLDEWLAEYGGVGWWLCRREVR